MADSAKRETVKLTRLVGPPTTDVSEVQLPPPTFFEIKQDPELIIRTLEACTGDVDAYIKHFTTRSHVANMQVLVQTLLILDRPENAEYKRQWQELINAYKNAKVVMAQNEALKAIADFKYGKGKKEQMNAQQLISLSRFWLADHNEFNKNVGRKKATTVAEEERDDPLDNILQKMKEE